MMIKPASLKINHKKINLITEEIEQFSSIFVKLENILRKINPDLIIEKIPLAKINKNIQNETYSILPNNYEKLQNKRNFFLVAENNIWSNFNFFHDYFKFSEYIFDKTSFKKMLIYRNAYDYNLEDISGKSFLNFFISRTTLLDLKPYSELNFFEKISPENWPRVRKKDMSFLEDKVSFKYANNWNFPTNFKHKINKVILNLSDLISKNIYKNYFFCNAEQSWSEYFIRAHKNYQYADYLTTDKDSVIINVGVECCEELLLFNGSKLIINVDPSGSNMIKNIPEKHLEVCKDNIQFYKKALYKLMSGGYEDNDLYKNYETTNLEEIVKEYNLKKLDIIKADIEGAERDMLDELIDLSKKFRTQFAICIYHSNLNNFELRDTVEIPLFLIDKLIDYNFYVGHYCYERWELVFYCIPKEKDNAPR